MVRVWDPLLHFDDMTVTCGVRPQLAKVTATTGPATTGQSYGPTWPQYGPHWPTLRPQLASYGHYWPKI